MVSMANSSCLNVADVDAGEPAAAHTRRTSAVASVARKHAVPDALSQLSVNTAA